MRSATVTAECGVHAAPHGSVCVWKRCSTSSRRSSPSGFNHSSLCANALAHASVPAPFDFFVTRRVSAAMAHLENNR
jgi:hypothetical protein